MESSRAGHRSSPRREGPTGRGASKRQEALAQLDIATDLVTDDAGQRGLLAKVKGQAYYQEQDYGNAVRELETVVQSRSGEANLHALLGHAYFETGQKTEALAELIHAVQLDRDNVVGLFFTARIRIEDGDYAEAVALAERAIRARPQDTGVRILLGSAYLGAGRYADAIRQLEVVIEEPPDDATAICNLGRAYSGRGNWPKAVEQFQRARNLLLPGSSTLAALLFDLGVAFETLGRHQDALDGLPRFGGDRRRRQEAGRDRARRGTPAPRQAKGTQLVAPAHPTGHLGRSTAVRRLYLHWETATELSASG